MRTPVSVSYEPCTNSEGYCERRSTLHQNLKKIQESILFGNGHIWKSVSYRNLFLIEECERDLAQGIDCQNTEWKYSGIIQISKKETKRPRVILS